MSSGHRHLQFNTHSRLEVLDLEVMLAVSEAGSFRKASRCLCLGQSGVTRRIQKLEDMIGVSLFERRATGARLTRAGWSFAERARSVVNDLHAAVDAAHVAGAGGDGKLNVGLIVSLSRGAHRDVVAEYASNYPEVEIEFFEAERSELLTLLSHRLLDVIIASGESGGLHGDGALLIEEPVYIAMHEDNPLAEQKHLTWDQVREAHFLVSATEPGQEIHEYLIRRLAELGHRPRVARHRVSREGIMNLVGLGFGVSLVADHWRGVRYPNVAFVPIGDEEEKVPFSLTWRPENDNPALRRFVSLARVYARKAAAGDAASRTRDPLP